MDEVNEGDYSIRELERRPPYMLPGTGTGGLLVKRIGGRHFDMRAFYVHRFSAVYMLKLFPKDIERDCGYTRGISRGRTNL